MIESTVTGNSPHVQLSDPAQLLTNQQQVYLPTNNALSDAGHVHLFLEQLGQGIQHLASRVPDLVAFIQRANAYRNITGEGLAFLNIPRSYYGRLTVEQLQATPEVAAAGLEAEALMASLVEAGGLVDLAGIVELELPTDPGVLEARLEQVLAPLLPGGAVAGELVAGVAATLRRGRYSNLHGLLRDRLSEEEYVRIVRNQILVDIQAGDVLYQIFTAPVMQVCGQLTWQIFYGQTHKITAPSPAQPNLKLNAKTANHIFRRRTPRTRRRSWSSSSASAPRRAKGQQVGRRRAAVVSAFVTSSRYSSRSR
eukprot:SAG11_NODE_354_length_10336_cov_3.789391_11_plen_310_part_00